MELRHQRDTASTNDPVGDLWRVYGPHGVLVYRRSLAPVPDLPGFDPGDRDYLTLHLPRCWAGCRVAEDHDPCPGDRECAVMVGEAPCHWGMHDALEQLGSHLYGMDPASVWESLDEVYERVMPDPDLIPA